MRELPEDIGPHEGKEFMLMRAGEKDVALFFEIEPEELTEVLSEGFCMLKFPQFEHLGATFLHGVFSVKVLKMRRYG